MVPNLSLTNAVHTTTSYLRSILMLSYLRPGVPSGIFYPIRVTCPAHLILLILSFVLTFGEEYEL
jgi:hypothetical protein